MGRIAFDTNSSFFSRGERFSKADLDHGRDICGFRRNYGSLYSKKNEEYWTRKKPAFFFFVERKAKGLFFIVFAESGLFIGFFLPGDSLLFTAGFLASQGYLNIWILAPLIFIAAILGDNFGYAFGAKVGPALFTKEDSLLFHKDHLVKANNFYAKHGPKTVVMARFLPIVRTFAPILAGVGKMEYRQFFF